jgi:predicted membrane GTPase involved in stress response
MFKEVLGYSSSLGEGFKTTTCQVIAKHTHDNNLLVNVTKTKQLTNTRASDTDAKNVMAPPIRFTL